jgi:hypothetical protein
MALELLLVQPLLAGSELLESASKLMQYKFVVDGVVRGLFAGGGGQ